MGYFPTDLKVFVSIHYRSETAVHKQYIPVKRIKYDRIFTEHDDFRHDMAMLELAEKVTCNSTVSYVWLPKVGHESLPKETQCVVLGWGKINPHSYAQELHKGYVEMIDHVLCESYENKVPLSHFCAGKWTGGVDTCTGDSGGPLVCLHENRWTLFGITSYGPAKCGEAHNPGKYSSVAYHLSFIQEFAIGANWNFMDWYSTVKECNQKYDKRSL